MYCLIYAEEISCSNDVKAGCALREAPKRDHPLAPLVHVFTPFLAEFTRSRLLRSPFHVHALPAVLCWTSSCRRHDMQLPQVIALCSWGSGGTLIPPAGPGQSPRGPRAPAIWHLKVQNTAQKLNFVVQFPCIK